MNTDWVNVFMRSHLPIFSPTHLRKEPPFNFLLLACNSQGFGLSVRYILYPMDGFFSSELRTKSPWPYLVECEP